MIKDNQQLLNRLHILLDGLVIVLAYLSAWLIKFQSGIFSNDKGMLSPEYYFRALTYIVPAYILLYGFFHMYTSKRVRRIRTEFAGIIKVNVLGLLGFLTILYFIREPDFSRTMIVIFFVLNIIFDMAFRSMVYIFLFSIRRQGYNIKYMLMVGYSHAAEQYIDRIQNYREWGYEVIGILDDNKKIGTHYKGVEIVGTLDELKDFLDNNQLDEIAITLGINEYGKLAQLVAVCEKSGVHTQFVPDYNKIIPTRPYTEDLMGIPIINIRYVPLSNAFNAFVKRLFDIIFSIIALILLSPLMLIISILIKLTSRGPLIFAQERIGLHNRSFKMYKFRSMKVQDENKEKTSWTVKDDPRVTGIGRFIRKTSIDELPQLINIIKGDMSIVGPRPERPFFVEKFKEEIPRYMIKHQVRPGLTGLAQINGYRGDTSITKRIECDLEYIENWTFELDLKIIFLTIFKGIINKNAY